jgi:hypothetical protein
MAVICGTPTPATTRVVQMRARADADLDRVDARVDERLGGLRGGDVARDDLGARVRGFARAHGVDHALRVAVRRVHDDHVDAGSDERLEPQAPDRGRGRSPRRRAGARARPSRRSGSVGLEQVLDGDEADQLRPGRPPAASRCGAVQQLRARSFETPGGTVTSSLVISSLDGLIEVLLEAQVAARREDADRLAVLHHGQAADVVLAHDVERLAQRARRLDRDGIERPCRSRRA